MNKSKFHKLSINVTRGDIKKGKRGSRSSCPIAWAIRRCLRPDHCLAVAVGEEIVSIDGKLFYLSEKPKDFIYRFDEGVKVAPFIFEISVSSKQYRNFKASEVK